VAVWRPKLKVAQGPVRPPVPAWATDIRLALDDPGPLLLDRSYQVKIHHPAGVKVVRARLRARSLTVKPAGPTVTTAQKVGIDPPLARRGLPLVLGLECEGERITLSRRLNLPDVVGAGRRETAGWHVLDGDEALTVQQAQQQPFAILPAVSNEFPLNDWVILEGSRWVCNVNGLDRPLGTLAGLGAPLTARVGPWNQRGEPLWLAKEVIDPGLLRDVIHDGAGTRLELDREVEPDWRHSVVWWDARGGLYCDLAPHPLEHGTPANWWGLTAGALEEPLAAAVAYEGGRLGGWWKFDWADSLEALGAKAPREVARLLRWLRLPLLAHGSQKEVRHFFHNNPADVLMAWVFDPPPEGLRRPASEIGWQAAVAELCREWQPTAAEIRRMLGLLPEASGDLELGGAPLSDEALALALAARLVRIDPLLMARVVHVCLQDLIMSKVRRNQLRLVLIGDVCQVSPAANESQMQAEHNRLLQATARTMQADDHFTAHLLDYARGVFEGQKPDDRSEGNLAVARSTIESFRRLLALDLLMRKNLWPI
jgi:hypothetical protein